ncbi:Charged multivesicular body protein 1b, partial [Lamprotornis superbus]
MSEHLFNLKFAAKELNRNSKKCDKEEKAEKAKIKKAIQKGNMEVARIHAENAIRQKNQAINFLRMSARVDAVAARVQTAVTMGKISALMDKFEHQFETLDVQTQQMEDTMSNTTTLTTPQNQVDMLLQEMADEAGLDLNMELPQGQTGSVATSVASAEQDELSQRLARLLSTHGRTRLCRGFDPKSSSAAHPQGHQLNGELSLDQLHDVVQKGKSKGLQDPGFGKDFQALPM